MFFCWDEADATDAIFCDMPAVDGGQTATQHFAGCHKKMVSIHTLKDIGEDEVLGIFKNCFHWHISPD